MDKAAIILAAGKGKRMKSDLPKVLHKLNGKPIVDYVIDNVRSAGYNKVILVIGHGRELVKKELSDRDLEFAIQAEQLGTGHAVKCAEPFLTEFDGTVLVLAGDMPLISPTTINKLTDTHAHSKAAATVLSVKLPDPTGYGRIVRNERGEFIRITEERDATPDIKRINEVNTGIICFDAKPLFEAIALLRCDNEQGEYYLTDCIEIYVDKGVKVSAVVADDYREGMGINSIDQLKEVEAILRED
ncbi:MAG: NTP transferase domain-containing protein [candidate division Zixibacteria bacterium]|nr:NTP transferase domain-containing protein [candidate division Zixibacteria bacterium]